MGSKQPCAAHHQSKTAIKVLLCNRGPFPTFARGVFLKASFPIPDIRLKRSIFSVQIMGIRSKSELSESEENRLKNRNAACDIMLSLLFRLNKRVINSDSGPSQWFCNQHRKHGARNDITLKRFHEARILITQQQRFEAPACFFDPVCIINLGKALARLFVGGDQTKQRNSLWRQRDVRNISQESM